MPITLEINHERREARATATGAITLEDIRVHLSEEQVRGGLPYRELIDASEATAAFDANDARHTVDIIRSQGSKSALGPTAIIVSNDLTYGMLRMLGMLLDDVCEFRPFRKNERAEAKQWLAAARHGGKTKED